MQGTERRCSRRFHEKPNRSGQRIHGGSQGAVARSLPNNLPPAALAAGTVMTIVSVAASKLLTATLIPSDEEPTAPIGTVLGTGNVSPPDHWKVRLTPPTEAILRLKVKTKSPAQFRVGTSNSAVELEPTTNGFGSPQRTNSKTFSTSSRSGSALSEAAAPPMFFELVHDSSRVSRPC